MTGSYDVVISLKHRVPLEDGWEDVIQQYQSQMIQNVDGTEVLAGTFDFYIANIAMAANRGIDIVDVADSIDQDLSDYCATLFEPGTAAEVREEIQQQFDSPSGSRMLMLHLAKVLPAHRGQHLALVTARKIIEQFADGLVIAMAQPLQHHTGYSGEKKMRYESFDRVPQVAKARLEAHWRRLGFEPIGESGYLGLNSANRLPEPKLRSQKRTRRVGSKKASRRSRT